MQTAAFRANALRVQLPQRRALPAASAQRGPLRVRAQAGACASSRQLHACQLQPMHPAGHDHAHSYALLNQPRPLSSLPAPHPCSSMLPSATTAYVDTASTSTATNGSNGYASPAPAPAPGPVGDVLMGADAYMYQVSLCEGVLLATPAPHAMFNSLTSWRKSATSSCLRLCVSSGALHAPCCT
jgi:hypothetical protein